MMHKWMAVVMVGQGRIEFETVEAKNKSEALSAAEKLVARKYPGKAEYGGSKLLGVEKRH